MMLDILRKKYAENEPMYLADVISTLKVSPTYARKLMTNWVKKGKIRRFARGIYYFPKKSKLFGEAPFNSQRVIVDKLLGNDEAPLGYYSGLSLANKAGITTQVPAKQVIVSNAKGSVRRREVSIGKRKILVSRPRIPVTRDNIRALSLLDLIDSAAKYSELSEEETGKMIREYAARAKVSRKQVRESVDAYPPQVSRDLIKMEIYDVLA